MAVSASTLRTNIYRLLDQVIETGQPLEVERKGHRLKIVPEKPLQKMDCLVKRDCIVGDPEQLVHIDWSTEWNDDLP